MKKALLVLFVLAVSIASAKSYTVTLFQPSLIAGAELKAGECRIELNGEKMTITQGKVRVESAVRVVENGEKYRSSSIRYTNGDGRSRIQEIRLGGTKIKLVVN